MGPGMWLSRASVKRQAKFNSRLQGESNSRLQGESNSRLHGNKTKQQIRRADHGLGQ